MSNCGKTDCVRFDPESRAEFEIGYCSHYPHVFQGYSSLDTSNFRTGVKPCPRYQEKKKAPSQTIGAEKENLNPTYNISEVCKSMISIPGFLSYNYDKANNKHQIQVYDKHFLPLCADAQATDIHSEEHSTTFRKFYFMLDDVEVFCLVGGDAIG